jgi:uroporphyrin-3 C-methyltransferase
MLDKDKPINNNTSKSTEEKKVLVVDSTTNTSKASKSEPSLSKSSTAKSSTAKSSTAESIKDKPSTKSSSTQPTSKTSIKNSDINSKNSTRTSTNTSNEAKQKVSKLAILALLISGFAIAGSTAHYVWQQQQNAVNIAAQESQTAQAIQDNKQRVKQELSATFSSQLQAQQQQLNAQIQQYTQQASSLNQNKIVQLTEKVALLEQSIQQRDPSDWLIHEAEYLIRIAARTMWLEQDTKSAIGLLKEADSRLAELQQPKFLPVRALIHQDIETLALMPTLNTQNAILSLMALNKQVSSLPLAGVDLSEIIGEPKQENLKLSDDISDWYSNLGITWDNFFKDFIVVHRRVGNVEPLMAPDQQAHVKQNLSLKIQLAQWAASEQKTKIYQQTLIDIQESLNQFFDMKETANKNFYQALEQAKLHIINYDYPSDLASLNAIKHLINQQTTASDIHNTHNNAKTNTENSAQTNKAPNKSATDPKLESELQSVPQSVPEQVPEKKSTQEPNFTSNPDDKKNIADEGNI